jgi:type IV pilus assembly protein PilX
LPLTLVNQVGMLTVTYKRAPECMVEPVPVVLAGTAVANTSSSFVVTARGFGPEVAAADGSRSHPLGSEVWLQSHVQFQ